MCDMKEVALSDGKQKKNEQTRKVHNRDYELKEKLDMATQYDKALRGTKGALLDKWGVHQTTMSRWVTDIPKFKVQIVEGGRAKKKTVRRKADPLQKIKTGVVNFYETNKNRTKHFKIPITGEQYNYCECKELLRTYLKVCN